MEMLIYPSPFAYDGLLYIDAGLSGPLFAIRPGASGDISLSKADKSNEYMVGSEPRGGTYLPTPVAYEGSLYVLSEKGILSRFDAKTGKLNYKRESVRKQKPLRHRRGPTTARSFVSVRKAKRTSSLLARLSSYFKSIRWMRWSWRHQPSQESDS